MANDSQRESLPFEEGHRSYLLTLSSACESRATPAIITHLPHYQDRRRESTRVHDKVKTLYWLTRCCPTSGHQVLLLGYFQWFPGCLQLRRPPLLCLFTYNMFFPPFMRSFCAPQTLPDLPPKWCQPVPCDSECDSWTTTSSIASLELCSRDPHSWG